MSVGKSSISRLTQAATAPVKGGIRSLAPEVPAGDAAVPAAEVKSPAKKTASTAKKSTGTKKSTAPKAPQATVKTEAPIAPSATAIPIGEALPYWLL